MTGRRGSGGRGLAAAELAAAIAAPAGAAAVATVLQHSGAHQQAEELALFWAHHEATGEHEVLQQHNFARAADLAYGLGRIVRATFGAPGPYPESLAAAFFQGLVAIPSNISTTANPILRRPPEPFHQPGGGGGSGGGTGGAGSSRDKGVKRGRLGGQAGGKTKRPKGY